MKASIKYWLILGFLALPWQAGAASFTVNFSDIQVDNVQPGVPVSLLQKAGFVLSVTNTSGLDTDIRFEFSSPAKSQVKAGFEPIPDVNWLKTENTGSMFRPGETRDFDLVVYAPYAADLFGKKFQAVMKTYTLEGTMKITLKSNIYLDFTGTKYTQDDLDQQVKKAETVQNAFSMLPRIVTWEKVQLPGEFTSREIMIKNIGIQKVTLTLYSVYLDKLPAIWDMVTFPAPVIELNPGEAKPVVFTFKAPNTRLKKGDPALVMIGARDTKRPDPMGQFTLLKIYGDAR
jgi:hypothetical protein